MSAAATTATDLAVNEATAQVNGVAAEPGFKVFAGNLTYQTDEAALKNFFQEFSADILSAQIIFHGHRSAGYGFVTFNTEDAANNAIAALDKKELNGRAVIVERAKPLEAKADRAERRNKRKFAGRRGSKAVPGEATEPKTDGETPAATGDAAAQGDAAKPKKKKKSTKKKAKKPANAEGATGDAPADGTTAPTDVPADATAPVERTRKPRRPKVPRRPRGEAPTGEPSTSVLFVANLAFSVDEAELTEFFTSAGVTVKSARVVRWRWGTPRKSKGYAFVDVGGPEEQKKAMEAVSGKTIADREVTVRVAVNAPHRGDDAKEGEDGAAPAADHVEPVVAVA
ncbi:hypothetical protein FS837_009785 [Tulasnella sp. UAMH 9824]|nr:hypothetical protein FS837_009785 [Tulasnella sp. UAMH 9824]